MKKQWQRPVLKTLKAGSAEATANGAIADGGVQGNGSNFRRS